MSLTADHKSKRDRARARHAIAKTPWILQEMLTAGFDAEGVRTKKGIRHKVSQMDKKKSWLGTSLLKHLVGNGFLQPDAAGYRITSKGLALRNSTEHSLKPRSVI